MKFKYKVIGLTQDNRVLAMDTDTIYYFDLFSEEILLSTQAVNPDKIIYYDKNFIITNTAEHENNKIEIYDIENLSLINSLVLKESFDAIIDITNDCTYIAIQQDCKVNVWNLRENNLIQSYDNAKVCFDPRGSYIVSFHENKYINKNNYIKIYDIANKLSHQIDCSFKIVLQTSIDIKIFNDDDSTKIILSAVFVTPNQPCNLIIYDLYTRKLIAEKRVSVSVRVPKPKQIVGVRDNFIILSAQYGFMDNKYTLWFANKSTGEYLDHDGLIDAGSICKVIDTKNEKYLLLECEYFNTIKSPPIQIYALHDKSKSKILDEKFY